MALILAPLMLLAALASLSPDPLLAAGLEFTGGVAADRFDGHKINSGASLRIRYVRHQGTNAQGGIMIQSNFHGILPINFDSILGYSLRTGGKFYLEAAAGLRYSYFFGPGLGVILGAGYHFGRNWYFNVPIVYRHGFSIEYTPYVGYQF